MIDHLTPEQERSLLEFRSRYLAYGLSTDPADRPRAEAAIARAYRRIGRDPVPVIWVDSPLTASLLLHILTAGASSQPLLRDSLRGSLEGSLRDSLRASLWYSLEFSLRDSLWASLWSSLWSSLSASLWDSLRASLEGSLEGSLRDSLSASLGSSLRSSLRSSLEGSLRDSLGNSLWYSLEFSLRDSLWASLRASLEFSLGSSLGDSLETSTIEPQWAPWWGSMELSWVAFYRFCAEIGVEFNPEDADGLNILDEIGQSCGWWYPRDGICVACERPEAIRMEPWGNNDRQRPHCEDAPAVQFRDGWRIYAWHGVRLSGEFGQRLIETPDSITREDLMGVTNAEVRRAALERLGTDRFVSLLDLEEIHKESWGHPEMMQEAVLLRTREPDPVVGEHIQFVRVSCPSTERTFHLCVPADVTRAREAVAWTFGMGADDYLPLIER